MSLAERFPPLYQCSVCLKAVKVDGDEKTWHCEHEGATIWAHRKVTLRGKGALDAMNPAQRAGIRITLTLRQLLSAMTGRSI